MVRKFRLHSVLELYPDRERSSLYYLWCEKVSVRKKISLLTDHKPLVTILGPQTAVPTLAALRMQRWELIQQAYLYDIEYRKSELNELKLYFMKRNELSMEQVCLLWGYRVVIPAKFQHVLLK